MIETMIVVTVGENCIKSSWFSFVLSIVDFKLD